MNTPKERRAKKGKFARRRQEARAKREGFVIRDGNAKGKRPETDKDQQLRSAKRLWEE